MKTKNKILILALAGALLLPSAVTKAQNINETESPALVNISISKNKDFEPKQFKAQSGKLITLELTNSDNSAHELRFSEKSLNNLTTKINPGQTVSITFEAPREIKNYPFSCSAIGSKQKGETGIMIVVNKRIPTNSTQTDEDITAKDLKIKEPKILPTNNILYRLKNLWDNTKIFLTIDPVKKAEMHLNIANKKLIEAKKLTEELNQPKEAIKTIDSYKKEIAKSIKIIENIKEKHQPRTQILSDRIIDNSFKQQKLIDRLEKEMDIKYSKNLQEAREKIIKHINTTINKTILPEKIESKVGKIIEKQKGSEFKDFKNLEILKAIEEKAPKQTRQAIQKVQKNIIQRLEKKIETMDEKKEKKFKNYVENIGGNEIHHLKIIEDMAKKGATGNISKPIAIAKEITINKINDKIEKSPDEKQNNFLNDIRTGEIENLRIIKEIENNASTNTKNKIAQIKKEVVNKVIKDIIKNTKTKEKEEKYLTNITDNHDIRQLEILKEIKDAIPENKKGIIQKARNETIRRIKDDIEKAKNDEEKAKILEKIAGDDPEQIKIIEEISKTNPIMDDIMEKQTEKIQNKIRIIEKEPALKQLKKRILLLQENENKKSDEKIKQIKGSVENKIKAITIEKPEAIRPLSGLKKPTNCVHVVTPAINPANNTCINFPTPCDVPSGWEKVKSCAQSSSKEESIKKTTCLELCKSLGYKKGICRKWTVTHSAKICCRNNETEVSATSDCFTPTSLVGMGKSCCCSIPKNKILPVPQKEKNNDKPIIHSPSHPSSIQTNKQNTRKNTATSINKKIKLDRSSNFYQKVKKSPSKNTNNR